MLTIRTTSELLFIVRYRTDIKAALMDPNMLTHIYQWATIGISVIIILVIPESPWWLVSKDKQTQAAKILQQFYGRVEGYDVQEKIVRLSPDMPLMAALF